MKNQDEILEQFTDKININKIFELIKSKKIIKTPHFYERLIFRDLDEEFVDKTIKELNKKE